jgi:hypothetical protein
MSDKNAEALKKIKEKKEVKGTAEQIQHADCILAALEKWEKTPDVEKEMFVARMKGRLAIFLQWWDSLKEIEKKYHVDAVEVAKQVRIKHCVEDGRKLAQKSKGHGIRDLYNACFAGMEGLSKGRVWNELNDKRFHLWIKSCPNVPLFEELGISKEEMKEFADFFCCQDEAIYRGFNPKFEVFDKSRTIMKGDSHCSYIIEDHGGE